jgi:signal transduction histidine kinase
VHGFVRVAQEALANALKHANTQKVIISLDTLPNQMRLAILDDDCEFGSTGSRGGGSHFGLLGMWGRAARIGATFSIISSPGSGCKISLELIENR